MEITKTEHSEIWVEEDIIMIKIFGTLNTEEIEKIAKTTADLINKFKNIKYVAVNASEVKDIPLGIRKIALDYFVLPFKEIAFVYDNPVGKVLISFFLRKYKMPFPAKSFSTIEEAKKWFKEE